MAIFVWPPVTLSTTSSPLEILVDGVPTSIEENTVTPANTVPMPSKLYFEKDGGLVQVNKDTGVPANTVGVPVEIVAASGTPINITAGDINVQLTDLGANFDRTRIGDGTNQWGMNASNEGLVRDAGAITKLTDIETTLNNGIDVVTSHAGATPSSIRIGDGVELLSINAANEALVHDADALAELVTANAKLVDIENAILAGGGQLQAVQAPDLVDTSTLSTTPLVITVLAGDISKILTHNASGNNLILMIGGAQQCIIPKGAGFTELTIKGTSGQAVELRTVAGAGSAGECSLSYLGV